jgi:ribosomal-protein-serine acetyltransferase
MKESPNPLLLDIPSELSGNRISLRIPRAGDGAIITPSVRESLTELKPWMPWATDEYDEKPGEEWCRRAAAHFLSREQLQFLIFLREDSRHIGNIGAFKLNWEVPKCEIGYWLHTAHTRKGFMTEAVTILRTYLHLRRIEIRSDPDNQKSRRVAQLAGFQLEGILRNECLTAGGLLRNTCIYSWIPAA